MVVGWIGIDGFLAGYRLSRCGFGSRSRSATANVDANGPYRESLFGSKQYCPWLARGCPGGPLGFCSFARYSHTAVRISNDTTLTVEAVDRNNVVSDTYTVVRANPSATPTATPTVTWTPAPTLTPTYSATMISSTTPTPTVSPTATFSPSAAWSATAVPQRNRNCDTVANPEQYPFAKFHGTVDTNRDRNFVRREHQYFLADPDVVFHPHVDAGANRRRGRLRRRPRARCRRHKHLAQPPRQPSLPPQRIRRVVPRPRPVARRPRLRSRSLRPQRWYQVRHRRLLRHAVPVPHQETPVPREAGRQPGIAFWSSLFPNRRVANAPGSPSPT